MLTRLLILSLVPCSAAFGHISSHLGSLLKGSAGALVTVGTARTALVSLERVKQKYYGNKKRAALFNVGLFLGAAYAVSTFAPYACKKLMLEPAELFTQQSSKTATRSRTMAALRGILCWAVAGTTAVGMMSYLDDLNQSLDDEAYCKTAQTLGTIAGLSYTVYDCSRAGLDDLRVVLKK